MSLLDSLPLDLELLIIKYKLGLETYESQCKKMKKCVKEIHKINYTYFYDAESGCYETIIIKDGIQRIYYIHDDGYDEIESSYVDKNTFLKYYLFENNRLIEYNDNT